MALYHPQPTASNALSSLEVKDVKDGGIAGCVYRLVCYARVHVWVGLCWVDLYVVGLGWGTGCVWVGLCLGGQVFGLD